MIEVKGVSKSYGSTLALDEVSFTVERNQIMGFLGPNGAGKSTAMKIITTYLSPDAGTVLVDGLDVKADPLAVRQRIGYLPEVVPLYDEMRTDKYLNFVAQARGLRGARLRERLEWVYETCSVLEVLYKPVSALSKGYRQRVGLAQALVHDPEILVLDEPTAGLDPRQIIDIRRLIHDLADTKTVIFSSHILAEISAVTNRIAIINEGRIVADGEIDQLRRGAMKTNRVVVELAAPEGEVADLLGSLPGVDQIEPRQAGDDDRRGFVITSSLNTDVRPEINQLARSRGWDVLALQTERPTLEEAFIELTGRGVSGA